MPSLWARLILIFFCFSCAAFTFSSCSFFSAARLSSSSLLLDCNSLRYFSSCAVVISRSSARVRLPPLPSSSVRIFCSPRISLSSWSALFLSLRTSSVRALLPVCSFKASSSSCSFRFSGFFCSVGLGLVSFGCVSTLAFSDFLPVLRFGVVLGGAFLPNCVSKSSTLARKAPSVMFLISLACKPSSLPRSRSLRASALAGCSAFLPLLISLDIVRLSCSPLERGACASSCSPLFSK